MEEKVFTGFIYNYPDYLYMKTDSEDVDLDSELSMYHGKKVSITITVLDE